MATMHERLLAVGKQHPEAFLKAAQYAQDLMLDTIKNPDDQEDVNKLMNYVLAGVLTDLGVQL